MSHALSHCPAVLTTNPRGPLSDNPPDNTPANRPPKLPLSAWLHLPARAVETPRMIDHPSADRRASQRRAPAPIAQVRVSQPIHYRASGRNGLSAWIAMPEVRGPQAASLVAVHGIKRSARDQAEAFAEQASALGSPVIAPEFDETTWPAYQQVVRKGRADLALLALIEELALSGIVRGRQFDLFGYSGGAQFAHRFAMLHPQRVRRLSIAAAGWYTFPDAACFPYGLGTAGSAAELRAWGPLMAQRLPEFLAIPITVLVGSDDCVPDESMRRRDALDRQQGKNRLSRAHAYVDALRMAASFQELPPPMVRLEILQNAEHDFRSCVGAGLVDQVLSCPQPENTTTHNGESDER